MLSSEEKKKVETFTFVITLTATMQAQGESVDEAKGFIKGTVKSQLPNFNIVSCVPAGNQKEAIDG